MPTRFEAAIPTISFAAPFFLPLSWRFRWLRIKNGEFSLQLTYILDLYEQLINKQTSFMYNKSMIVIHCFEPLKRLLWIDSGF